MRQDISYRALHFQGDSGGPLFVTDSTGQFVLIGLLLQVRPVCGEFIDEPDVYANVGSFTDWIISKIK